VVFGPYSPVDKQNVDSTGRVDISCLLATPYTIALSSGLSSSFFPRAMASGASRLSYNLYTSVGHSVVWGDGTSGTAVIGNTAATASHTVYGRIPGGGPNAAVGVGVYADTVVVTVSF
jgi:spore coat protein U-like protein